MFQRFVIIFSLGMGCVLFGFQVCAVAQSENADDEQANETASRFLSILERNPQHGTALEKVYIHHLHNGTLNTLVQSLENRTKADSSDSAAWMLLGLIESQRRFDEKAILAFSQAEQLRPKDALPCYYRGQSLLRIGEPTEAIKAFEMAVARQPSRSVLIEVFEQMGRSHQRQNRNDLAVECWKRLEALFPDDVRVLEHIASVQTQEGDFRDALPRYKRLIDLTKEDYKRTCFRIELTHLQIKLGDRETGLAGLESVLSDLKPDGWLYREVLDRIEAIFLEGNDRAGVIQFYEKRLSQLPDDIDSIIRISKLLLASSRISEANTWMLSAIKRAPSRLDLRRSYIDQLVADQQFVAALDQFGELSRLDPSNLEILRDWGKLVLRDTSRTIDDSRREASRIWHKIVETRPDDPLAHIQVADLLISASLPEEAEQLFKLALSLAPDDAQYSELYGEFLFQQGRKREAFAIWDAIADGPRRNIESLMRVAEIYRQAQQFDKAADLAFEACQLDPDDPILHIRTAKMQFKANRIDAALAGLSRAESLSKNAERREGIIEDRIAILEQSKRLEQETQSLQTELESKKGESGSDLERSQLLVRYLVRLKRWKEAETAVANALTLDEKNIAMLFASSMVAEGLNDPLVSIDALRKLAELDRYKRQEYLQQIARLQIKIGKRNEAIETGSEAVRAMPAKIEGYEFLAQICFQAKQNDLGIETLRRALRMEPGSTELVMALGNALSDNRRFAEALEHFWQAFVSADKLNIRLDLVDKLVKIYQLEKGDNLQNIEFSQDPLTFLLPLVQRLEEGSQNPSQRYDFSICLSRVYQTIRDFEKAEQVLNSLWREQPRDSSLLKELSQICSTAGNLEGAIDYQLRLVDLVPGHETENRLATLLRQRGDWNEANAILVKLIQNERDPEAVLKNLDSLLQKGELTLAAQALEPLLLKQPANWELLYRNGMALAELKQWGPSRAAFEKILSLQVGPEENRSVADEIETIERSELLQIASSRSSWPTSWAPKKFVEVRWASVAWLVRCEMFAPEPLSWVATKWDSLSESKSRSDWLDAFALAAFKQETGYKIHAVAGLISLGEPDLARTFLGLVRRRQVSSVASENKQLRPLESAQLQLLIDSFEKVKDLPVAINNTNSNSPIGPTYPMGPTYSTSILNLSNRTISVRPSHGVRNYAVYSNSHFPIPTSTPRIDGFVRTVANELCFAGRRDESEALLAKLSESSQSESFLFDLCSYLLDENRISEVEKPLLRWFDVHLGQIKNQQTTTSGTSTAVESPTAFAFRLIDQHAESFSTESMIRFLDLAATISDQQVSNHHFPPLSPSSLSRKVSVYAASYAGSPFSSDKNSAVQDWATSFVSVDLQKLLHLVGRKISSPKVSISLEEILEHQVEQSPDSVRPLAKVRLALSIAAKLPSNSNSLAIEAVKELAETPEFHLHAAASLLDLKCWEESRSIAEKIESSDLQDQITRELIVMHASLNLNDAEQAKKSVQWLSDKKMDMWTTMFIEEATSRLNLKLPQPQTASVNTRQKAIINTNRTRSGQSSILSSGNAPRIKPPLNETELLKSEMLKHSKEGNKSRAIEIARQIVSKPKPVRSNPTRPNPVRPTGGPLRYNFNSTNPTTPIDEVENLRINAMKLLLDSDELKKLIEETEQRLIATPNSFSLLELLAEYYEYYEPAFHWDNTMRVLKQAIQLRPNASSLRIRLANLLCRSQKYSEACDQHLEVLRRDTNRGLVMLAKTYDDFKTCGRTKDLEKVVLDMNFHAVRDVAVILEEALAINKDKESSEIAESVLEKLAELNPGARQQVMERSLTASSISRRPYSRFLSFELEALLPTGDEIERNPWAGLECSFPVRLSAYLETPSTYLELLFRCHRKQDVIENVKPRIQELRDRFPDWYAGHVMLAIIAEYVDQEDELKQRVGELAAHRQMLKDCPDFVAYKLGVLFAQHAEVRSIGLRLLEPLVGNPFFVNVEREDRPSMILAKAWVAEGQREKAFECLSKDISTEPRILSPGNPKSERTLLAEEMLLLGLPVEGYRLLQLQRNQLLEMQGKDSTRVNNGRSTPEDTAKQVEVSKQKAFDMIEQMPVEQAIRELLLDRTDVAKQLPALELLLEVPPVSTTHNKSIESVAQDLLIRHANGGHLTAVEEGLLALAKSHLSDVSVLATLARLRLEISSEDATKSLAELEAVLSPNDQKMKEHSEIDKSIVSQTLVPENAQSIVATWLIAKQCYKAGKYVDFADRFAQRALDVAKLIDAVTVRSIPSAASRRSTRMIVPEAELANIILFEWGRALIQAGRIEEGEAKWNEIVDLVYAPMEKDSQQASMAGGSAEVEESGWRRGPLEWLIRICTTAIDEQQVEVSKSIFKRIADKQLPIQISFELKSPRLSELKLKPAVRLILSLLAKWPKDKETASDQFAILLPIFLARDTEVFLFMEHANLLHEKPICLVDKLIESAKQSDRLLELKQQLELRELRTSDKLNWLILSTKVAIAANDLEGANQYLIRLSEFNKKTMLDHNKACHAAIPALDFPALREAALLVVNEYLASEKATGNYPGVDFSLFPLVREVGQDGASQP